MSASHSVLGCSVPKHRTRQCRCTLDAKCPQDHLSLNKWGSDGGIDTQQGVLGGAHRLLLVYSHLGGSLRKRALSGLEARGRGRFYDWGFPTSLSRREAEPRTPCSCPSHQPARSICSFVLWTRFRLCLFRRDHRGLLFLPRFLPGVNRRTRDLARPAPGCQGLPFPFSKPSH